MIRGEVVRGFFYYFFYKLVMKNISFPLFLYPRVYIRNYDNISLKNGVTIAPGSFLSPIKLNVGSNSWIGNNAFICGKVSIGNNVMIGPNVVIPGAEHNHKYIDIPICFQGNSIKGTIIEDDVWIGANVVILDGVSVEKGAIVAAGSVVTSDVNSYSIVAGVPAKHLKWRGNEKG